MLSRTKLSTGILPLTYLGENIMTELNQAISPLRQRMISDMQIRELSAKTKTAYLRAVNRLSICLEHSPADATSEELRQFQIMMAQEGGI